jgi:HD-GYP domain-containing protein (c-di-GMP phosphodiesterase class II)
MTATKELLDKIASLRQRLDQAQGLAQDAAAALAEQNGTRADPVQALQQNVLAGAWHNRLIDTSLREVSGGDGPPPTVRLSARGARLLRGARQLLQELRTLAEEPCLQNEQDDCLGNLYRETVAIIDMVLRTVQAFPQAPTAQARLCDGLDAILGIVGDRLSILMGAVTHRQREVCRIDTLAELLRQLVAGHGLNLAAFLPLAESLREEADQDLPLRFLYHPPDEPARFVACHSLNVAQVIGRLVRHDPEWRGRREEPILAALLHDAGMLSVPAGILNLPGPLDDGQRRIVESHAALGAQIVSTLGAGSWLAAAAAGHHERVDGTGYPAGLNESQLPPLLRLLAVCDVYTALCAHRPYRPALDTRTALTDVLLLAEQGALDRFQAERLLEFSFYPVGSVVELSDGAIGIVLAAQKGERRLSDPARPLVGLLLEQGRPLAIPRQTDLAEQTTRTILRALPANERRALLGKSFPVLAD